MSIGEPGMGKAAMIQPGAGPPREAFDMVLRAARYAVVNASRYEQFLLHRDEAGVLMLVGVLPTAAVPLVRFADMDAAAAGFDRLVKCLKERQPVCDLSEFSAAEWAIDPPAPPAGQAAGGVA